MTDREHAQIAAAAVALFSAAALAMIAALLWLVDHREQSRTRDTLTREHNRVTVSRKPRRRER